MDPALYELARHGPDDEVGVIVRLRDPQRPPASVRVVNTFGDIATVRVRRRDIPDLWADPGTLSVKAPHLYAPDVEAPEHDAPHRAAPTGAGAVEHRHRGPQPAETGRGVVIGIADWGIDFAHPDFRRPDGTSRLLALWDQRPVDHRDPGHPAWNPGHRAWDPGYPAHPGDPGDPGGPGDHGRIRGLPGPSGTGRLFTSAHLDAALRRPDPYRALGYHPADFDHGSGAHGTHTLSIAAGGGLAGGPPGVAPEAAIVAVSLPGRAGTGGVPLGSSGDILDACAMIFETAGDRPCVINLSLGRHAGEHTGRQLLDQALDHLVGTAKGRAIVLSCGNYFQRRTHASWRLRPGEERTFRVEVDPADRTANQVDIWYPGRDRLTVTVATADGAHRQSVPLGGRGAVRIGGRETGRIHHRACDPNNGDHQIALFLDPAPHVTGWDVTLRADDVVDGRVHAWIERDGGCRSCQAHFGDADVDTDTTLGTLANGFRTLTVGAYDAHDEGRPPAPFSSCGPTRDGRQKPDLAAPGVRVTGARSRPRDGAGGPAYVRMSGTSMAAPAVTGTVALMFQAAGRPLAIEETRRALLAGCEPPGPGVDPRRVGSGYLRTDRAVAAVRAPGAGPAAPGVPLLPAQAAGPCPAPDLARMAQPQPVPEPEPDPTARRLPEPMSEAAGPAAVPGCGEPVAAGARPAVLRTGSRHPAVGDAQRLLNAFGARELRSGRLGLPYVPLVVDCAFGDRTYAAVLDFQRRVFPDRPREHDGRIGPRTWAALEAALKVPITLPADPCAPSRMKVAVIGGGFAGLAAAWWLTAAGVQVTLFEAAKELGGRVRTDRSLIPGKVLEAGAELIGENHVAWRALAKAFGLTLEKITSKEDYGRMKPPLEVRLRFGSHDLTEPEQKKLAADLRPVLRRIGAEARAVDARRPWTSRDAAKLDAMSLSDRLDDTDMFGRASSPARHFFEFVTENDQCVPVADQSYLGFLAAVKAHSYFGDMLAYWSLTETRRCQGGNDRLAAALAGSLTGIRLDTEVTAVEARTGGIRVTSLSGGRAATADFDYAIMAAPPAVWPTVTGHTPFVPADYTMQHGPCVKFLSTFDDDIWTKDGLAPTALWDQLGSVWEGTDNQHTPPAGRCLTVYSGGGYVLDPTKYQARLPLLYPRYPAELKKTLMADWPKEPFIRTGYSVPGKNQVTTVAKNLSGSYAGRLFFAGEQASPGFFGYMEGALQSGLLAAFRVGAAWRASCGRPPVTPEDVAQLAVFIGTEAAESEANMIGPGGLSGLLAQAEAEAEYGEAVGPCPDVPVPPAARPRLLKRGSEHTAVRAAQRRLNAIHADEVAAGRPGIPGAPLVDDCQFAKHTHDVVLAFQRMAFPGKPGEQDGEIGPHTWAALDAGLAPVTAPPSPPMSAARPVTRPCCMLESGSLAGVSTFGDHADRTPRTVYTGKAGFVDLGHLWDTCDGTAFAYQEIHRAGGRKGTKVGTAEGGEAVLTSDAPRTEWMELARSIAYDDALAHEIVTYPLGAGACGRPWMVGRHNSSFSPEDLCSNYLGTLVAERTLKAGGPFVAEAERQVAALLLSLDGQSDTETRAAFAKISGRWVDSTLSFTDACFLKRRNFSSVPWKAGHKSDAPTPAFVVRPFKLTATYDYTHPGGVSRADFGTAIAKIKTAARTQYGPDFATP
ncbi:DUF4056 domain-containing protein [Streptomyces sp. NRRL S-87]|uniref:DUF4056 domain-containing protein n=1 Tax=Streptomyces sp. NRRL S-87 TaxID=1463920 RepID=UPI00055F7F60|nr:DUF4056 domain-containing protein [Streptomyces sp. NRRL S-87]